jgi:hypothetical protein
MAIATTSITVANNDGSGTWVNRPTGGVGSAQNTNIFLTSTGSRARKISNETRGYAFEVNPTGVDLSAQVIAVRWLVTAGVNLLDTRTVDGVRLIVEDTSGNESYWDLDGNDTYTGGWKVSVVSMATTESSNNGTPATLTAVQYVGIVFKTTGVVGGGDPNSYIDEIIYFPIAGLAITGNSTTLFDDLVDTIDDDATNGPFGIIERRGEQIFSKAKIDLQPDATDMSETDRNIIFENPVYDAGTTIDSCLDEIGMVSSDADNITFTRCSIVSAEPDEAVTTDANREFDVSGAADTDGDTTLIRGFDGTGGVSLNSTTQDWGGSTFQGVSGISVVGAVTLTDTFIRLPTTAVDVGALVWNLATDPDTYLDGATFTKGTNAHHAIDFGTSVTADIILRNIEFAGFGSTEDGNDAPLRFLATTGSLNCSLIGCTVGGVAASASNFAKDDAAGIAVTLIFDPVTTLVHVDDNTGVDLQNARVLLEAADGAGDFPFEDTVTIVRSGATATVTHTGHGLATNDWVVIRGADQQEYNGPFQITFVDVNSYTYTVSGAPDTPATGTIISSGAILSGLTDVNGDISVSRTFSSNTNMKGSVRKSSASPRFKSFLISGTVNNVTGLTINVRLVSDE